MQMVAAAKMRRAQAAALATRPYAHKAWELLTYLAAQTRPTEEEVHPLLTVRPVENVGLLLIAGDRGLCGGYNNNVVRRAVEFIQAQEAPVRVVTVGRKGRDFAVRLGWDVVSEFHDLGAQPSMVDVLPVARTLLDDYRDCKVDRVYMAYTEFVNTLVQRVVVHRLLPIRMVGDEEARAFVMAQTGMVPLVHEFIYEPSARTVLDSVIPRFTEVQVYQAILESIASEESARMVAMRSATDNANDLLDRLTLSFNQARQTAITKEMLDIAAGAEALTKSRAARV
jgi:F-type H+-transporting ATPase subunit gamma